MKTARSKVTKALISYLSERGAESIGEGEFTLDTPIGPLRLTVRDGWVYRCFTSHRAGYEFSRSVNRCSGKWNLCLPCADADECLMYLQADLDRLAAYKPTADCLRLVREDIDASVAQTARFAEYFAGLRGAA